MMNQTDEEIDFTSLASIDSASLPVPLSYTYQQPDYGLRWGLIAVSA